MKFIKQGVSEESLFLQLQKWCRTGAGQKRHSIQIVSAFATGTALEALEPFFDVFLADGNRLDIIVGIDRNGTDRDAIRRLYELQHAYTKQVTCRIFHAPSRLSIFHPKLYIYRSGAGVSAVIGSANLTAGGLAHNFEDSFLFESLRPTSSETAEVDVAWRTYAEPKTPLQQAFLRPLTQMYARQLLRMLPAKSSIERGEGSSSITEIWKPLSQMTLPRSAKRAQRRTKVPQSNIKSFLVIDVLNETRGTQMQFPLAVVEDFFGIARDEAGSIHLSQLRGECATQAIERPVVISSGKKGARLMRRIEMPQIDGKERPLAAAFLRRKGNTFAVAVLPKKTAAYRVADSILQSSGQQPGFAARRYYIGSAKDKSLKRLLAALAQTGVVSTGAAKKKRRT